MSNRPIFVATHPRSCSTAFERVFMTQRDALHCIHEPFGDAFYYGPERLSSRYESDEKARLDSGFAQSTFRTVLDRIEKEGAEGKRIFIKDIIHYLVPPNGAPPSIAPSLARKERGIGTFEPHSNDVASVAPLAPNSYATEPELRNPTVVPSEMLGQFHFTFLIRHPRYSIPSYYRCTVPPLDEVTGFHNFMPSEAGYDELRRVFDFLRSVGQVGPEIASQNIHVNGSTNGNANRVDICVVDADDLLDNPAGIIAAYCKSVGIGYHEQMLSWDSEEDQKQAKDAFEKWKGFHEDAMNSCDLKPRKYKKKAKSDEEEDREWVQKFGTEGAKVIRQTVNANFKDYEYLKQFALTA
ncbi:hypothetical protein HO173_008823 [Letharia columbiana]|uniref:P-loop containing nucleoside triphosphate hydrolase protein n=1 Tax=Letharia columbiana TaxID=112416 RepID=A0A8H6FQJ3_9LECA|nr:uncharacterized protein HO173_008823 [Letharia columbiana]KAF6232860.1 hypothetical protein HO173_008823 [Letharia columbiana]